jgi:hypothetical protein
LWVAGVVSLLWNAGGGYDYIMTVTENADYFSQYTPEQIDYLTSSPVWTMAAWAIAVWSAILGSVLLLLRSRWAEPAFWLSLAAILATAAYSFVLSEVSMAELIGPFAVVFSVVVLVVAVLLVAYSHWMRKRGVLA